ncbi:MAG TPA: metallophosphoesterase [Bacteroidales bacterium]|nr:metallophosphoesterase [Bacteroidales bacterium]
MSLDKDSEEFANSGQNEEPLFSFGIIADVQYADKEPAGTRYYRSSITKLREAISAFKQDSVDFVITLGDLIDQDIRSYNPLLNIMDSSGLKFYHVSGNHDYSVDPAYIEKLPEVYIQKPGYFAITHKNFRFIFINGNEISTYSNKNKSNIKEAETLLDSIKKRGEQNAVEWNGAVSKKQLIWLDKQINKASLKNSKVILICHFPVFPENIHNLLNYKDVLSVMEKYNNCLAWFNGHNHAGNYGKINKTHFVTFKGMVETENQNSFARVDVYSNKIWIIGSGREKIRKLAE